MVPRSDLAVTALWCRNRRVGRPQRVENSPSPPVRLDVSYWALNPAKRRTASGRKPVRTPARSSHRGGAARRVGARKPRHRMERPLADVKIEGWTAVSGKATSPGQWLERLLHPLRGAHDSVAVSCGDRYARKAVACADPKSFQDFWVTFAGQRRDGAALAGPSTSLTSSLPERRLPLPRRQCPRAVGREERPVVGVA
jgi:hypothetical protein